MKKDLGSVLALYPTPLVVVGTMVDKKPNWVLVGHVGIMGHDHIMVSLEMCIRDSAITAPKLRFSVSMHTIPPPNSMMFRTNPRMHIATIF